MLLAHDFSVSGLRTGGSVLRCAVGLESWFQLPEQGMQKMEILARGSAFVTPAASHLQHTLHVLAPAHVTHPWRYRGDFYAGDQHAWLDHVREEAVQVRLTVRALESGAIVHTSLLENPQVHGAADLAVYRICDEASQLQSLENLGFALMPIELCAPGEAAEGTATVLVGNDLRDERLVPVSLNGRLEGHAGGAAVVSTVGATSMLGMCGGPALVAVGSQGNVKAAGLVFARVESGPLTNHTLLVSSGVISDFLAQNKQ